MWRRDPFQTIMLLISGYVQIGLLYEVAFPGSFSRCCSWGTLYAHSMFVAIKDF